jgi:hypothetical protein
MKVSRKKLNLLRLNVLLEHAFCANAHWLTQSVTAEERGWGERRSYLTSADIGRQKSYKRTHTITHGQV